MPTAVTLTVNLTAPSVGSSSGDTALSTTAADLVTGVSKVAEGSKTIGYTLSATVAAGVVASDTRTVTFTAGIVPAGTRTVSLTLTDG